jgi:hypothetical protein
MMSRSLDGIVDSGFDVSSVIVLFRQERAYFFQLTSMPLKHDEGLG